MLLFISLQEDEHSRIRRIWLYLLSRFAEIKRVTIVNAFLSKVSVEQKKLSIW